MNLSLKVNLKACFHPLKFYFKAAEDVSDCLTTTSTALDRSVWCAALFRALALLRSLLFRLLSPPPFHSQLQTLVQTDQLVLF